MLGSGNAALINQTFSLAKSPLTFPAGSGGPANTLAVYVNGIAAGGRELLRQAPGARVFVVSRSPDQTVTTVTFGDGVNGARPPSGSGNITATYRYGSRAAAPPAGRLMTIVEPQPNLATLESGRGDGRRRPPIAGPRPTRRAGKCRQPGPGDLGRGLRAGRVSGAGVDRATAYGRSTADSSGRSSPLRGRRRNAVPPAIAALAGTEDPNRPVAMRPRHRSRPACRAPCCSPPANRGNGRRRHRRYLDPVAGLFAPARWRSVSRCIAAPLTAALTVPGVLAVALTLFVAGGQAEVFTRPGWALRLSTDALAHHRSARK